MGTIAHTQLRAAFAALALAAPGGLAGQQPSAPARTPDVVFVPTDTTKVREMLAAARVDSKDVVYDLGCGDGRIVIAAVKKHGARRGVCVDIDPVRIKESKRNADTAGVRNRIEFIEGDLFEQFEARSVDAVVVGEEDAHQPCGVSLSIAPIYGASASGTRTEPSSCW